MSGVRNFSTIARALLLTQPNDVLTRAYDREPEAVTPVPPPRAQSEDCLWTAMRNISLDMLDSNEESSSEARRRRTPEARTVIAHVKQFFAKLKEHLGSTSRGTIFDSVTAITATACGVSSRTVSRVSGESYRPAPARTVCRGRSRKVAVATATANFGAEWGERIRRQVHGMLREEKDVTIAELRRQMQEAYPDFSLSAMTLWRLVKGLGFSYKIVKGQRFIFERLDLARKRSLYLRKIDEARTRGDCVVYMDETWVFEGMVKRRGWVDNTMSRFPSAEAIQQYSCGKTAGKNKGRRGIVITALCEEGIIPGSTHVLVSGHRTAQGDVQREMDHSVFEEWLTTSIPLMKEFAAGRNVTLVLDNAPYHTRALEKIPTRRSTIQEIVNYLSSHGVEVAEDSTRASLQEELDHFVASRGGVAALRCYAAERICEEMGVNLLRLPPFHCYFNPVELCWSYLKYGLNKIGKPTDRLETVMFSEKQVRMRAVEIMGRVSRDLCEAWCGKTIEEEDSARLKEALDAGYGDMDAEEPSSSDSDLSDDVISGYSVEL